MPVNTNAWNRIRYTLYAPLYDRVAAFPGARRRAVEVLDLRPGERVLVDGAGTGADLDFLPPDVEASMVDLTPAMVERIRARAARLGRTVDARVMDAHALDYPDASFDAVILNLIVAVVPDPKRALREAARVLKPGGRAVVFDKFVAEDREASPLRRAVNLVANLVATDVTRKLSPLLEGTGLRVVHREPAMLGGLFEIALLRDDRGAAAAEAQPRGRRVRIT